MEVQPTLLIGLGEAGAAAVAHTRGAARGRPELSPFLAAFTLGRDGIRDEGEAGRERATAPLPDDAQEESDEDAEPVEDAELAENGALFRIEVEEGVWQANTATAERLRPRIVEAVKGAVERIRRFDVVGRAPSSEGVTAGHVVEFYVIAKLDEPTGSPLLLPVLEAIEETRVFFQHLPRRVNVVLFTPDLTPGRQPTDVEYARAYVTIQELEWALDVSERARQGGFSLDLIWVLASQNEEGLFVEGYGDLLPAVSDLVLAGMTGEALRDRSFGVALKRRVYDRTRRYSSFGQARLVFPRNELVGAATDSAVSRTLGTLTALADVRVEAPVAYAQARAFIQANKLDGLVALLRVDVNGREVWRPFAPPPRDPLASEAEAFLEEFRAYQAEYEREAVNEMRRAVGERRAALFDAQREALHEHVDAIVNREEPGGVAAAHAWLAAFEGAASPFLSGDVEDRPLTLAALDKDVRAYFDERFEPVLLGEIQDAERSAYLEQRPGAPTRRRELLRQLRLDLDSKRRGLEQERTKLAHLDEDLVVREAERARLGGADRHPDPDKEALEPEVATAEGTGPAESSGGGSFARTDTDEDRDLREAAAAAALDRQIEELRQRREACADAVEAYEADVELLERIERRTADEVAALDRAIGDAAERRRLYDLIAAEAVEAASALEGKYRDVARRERAELGEAAALRRGGWRALLYGAVGSLALSAVFSAVALLLFDRALAEVLTVSGAIVAFMLAVAAGVWWWAYERKRGAHIRAAAQLREVRRRVQQELVVAYTRLHREQFEHTVFGSLADWRDGMRRYVAALREGLVSFADALRAAARRTRERADAFRLPHSPSVEYVLPPSGVEGLLEWRAEALRFAAEDFWRVHPLSEAFAAHRASGEAGLQAYLETLSGALRTAFHELEAMSLDAFVAEALPREEDRRALVNRVYRRAAPFVSLSDVGATQAPPEAISYIGLWETDRGPVRAVIKDLNIDASFAKARSDTEVSVLRLSAGYAAFQLAPLAVARHYVQHLGDGEVAGLLARPEYADQLRDLVPSEIELGDHDDETRRLACLGLTYGCASWTGKGETEVQYGKRTFISYGEWVRHLHSPTGTGDRERLAAEVHQRQDEALADPSLALRTLQAYRNRPGLDHVDLRIVESEMERYT